MAVAAVAAVEDVVARWRYRLRLCCCVHAVRYHPQSNPILGGCGCGCGGCCCAMAVPATPMMVSKCGKQD